MLWNYIASAKLVHISTCPNEKLDEELILSLRKTANMRGLEKFKADHKEFFNRVDENVVRDKSK